MVHEARLSHHQSHVRNGQRNTQPLPCGLPLIRRRTGPNALTLMPQRPHVTRILERADVTFRPARLENLRRHLVGEETVRAAVTARGAVVELRVVAHADRRPAARRRTTDRFVVCIRSAISPAE
jgi:hypothetical protein